MADPKDSDFTPTSDPTAPAPPAETVVIGAADLTEDAVETLGSFMLDLTERNFYHPEAPVEQSTPDDPELLGTQERSDIVADGSASGFFAGVQDAAAAYYATITDGSTPDAVGGGTFGPLGDFLDKTSQVDGHNFLGEVVGDAWSGVFDAADNAFETPEPKSSIRGKVSEVLKYNRFSPGGESPYIQDQEYSNGMFSIQKLVGRYDENADPVAFSELAKIGFSMMLSATGASEDDSNPASADSTNAIGQGIDVQLALSKVDSSNLYAGNAHGFPAGTPRLLNTVVNQSGLKRKGTKTEADDGKNSKSYGQLNSYLEPFDGPLPIGMIVLSVIAAVAVLIAGIILAAIISLIFLMFPPGMSEEPPEPLPLGAASGQPDFGKMTIGKWLMKMLRMPILRSGKSFLAAMFYGVLQFYWRITDAISSGYFIIISRAAIRDLEQISDSIADADFSNIVGGLESIFVVLDAFATSTTFQFLNTLAALGDIVLMAGGFGGGDMEFSPYTNMAGQPDRLPPAIANLHMKSRTLMDGSDSEDYRLAWRFGSLPSRFLLPPNLLGANAALGRNIAFAAPGKMSKGWGALGQKTQKFEGRTTAAGLETTTTPDDDVPAALLGGRFSAEVRQEYEDELNAYYMPFYFHDLRTNEILALHTFIDNFTDSFTPEWNSVGGFGRMDDVQIYKKTKRSMGLSFFMVATGPEDLDELYYGINRLVAMVYPQWSKGTLKKYEQGDEKYTFIMPFSQVPTASPIVRLRVGDLWSSNYSLTALSRLFGLGTSSFTINGKPPYPQLGAAVADKQSDVDGKVLLILDEIEKLHSAAQNGPPAYEEAMLANAGVLAGGLLVPDVTKGFSFGAKVIVKPSRYKKGKWEATKVSFKKALGKFLVPNSLEQDRRGEIAGYVVQPVVPSGDTEEEKEKSTRKKAKARVRYAVKLDEAGPLHPELTKKNSDLIIICGDGDLILDHEHAALAAINSIVGSSASAGGIPNPFAPPPDLVQFDASALKDFFGTAEGDLSTNSIARAFHESGGQGIAGAITQLDFDWNIAPWDERPGYRAPTFVKVSMGFLPIHDIPLGLDNEGAMRAPAYNIGGVVRGLFGTGHSLKADENTRAILTAALKKLLAPAPDEEAEPTGDGVGEG